MKFYHIIYLHLRITLFIATHFYIEPEYLKELYNEYLLYGNAIPASQYMKHGIFMKYVNKLEKIIASRKKE
jgi:hypothetical protein